MPITSTKVDLRSICEALDVQANNLRFGALEGVDYLCNRLQGAVDVLMQDGGLTEEARDNMSSLLKEINNVKKGMVVARIMRVSRVLTVQRQFIQEYLNNQERR